MNIINENQQIDENHFLEDINFIPLQVKNFLINNSVIRSIAHLCGMTNDRLSKMLRCTSGGILQVVVMGAGYEHNITYSGNTTASWSAPIIPIVPISRMEIWVSSNGLNIKRYNTLSSYDDLITIPAGGYYTFDAITAQFALQDAVNGSHATYQIVAWY